MTDTMPPLPDWTDRVANDPVSEFVYNNEPAGANDEREFRDQLTAALHWYAEQATKELRAEVERLRASQPAQGPVGEKRIANAIHYPACWDTAAYPELDDALAELFQAFRCQECAPPADDEAVRLLREIRVWPHTPSWMRDAIDAYLAKKC